MKMEATGLRAREVSTRVLPPITQTITHGMRTKPCGISYARRTTVTPNQATMMTLTAGMLPVRRRRARPRSNKFVTHIVRCSFL